jgi:hypothetical protein
MPSSFQRTANAFVIIGTYMSTWRYKRSVTMDEAKDTRSMTVQNIAELVQDCDHARSSASLLYMSLSLINQTTARASNASTKNLFKSSAMA